MANKTKIIRSVESTPNNFTPLSNKLLQDMKLSIDTRGLLAYIISLPADWVVYKENIQKQLGFGRKKMDRMWNEAKKGGYLQSKKFRESNGTWNYEYIISDVPLSTVPLSTVGSSDVGKGYTKQRTLLQSIQLENKESRKSLDTLPKGNVSYSRDSIDTMADFYNEEKMNEDSSLWWDESQPSVNSIEELASVILKKLNK